MLSKSGSIKSRLGIGDPLTASRKAIRIATIALLGVAVVYINLTFKRAVGPEVEVEAVESRYLEAIVSASGTIVPQLTVETARTPWAA